MTSRRNHTKSALALAGALTCLTAARARSHAESISLASDAAPWFLSGYSLILSVEPDVRPRWRFSAELWGFELPELYVELEDANANEGWKHRVDLGLAIYADYHLGGTEVAATANEGYHVGAVLNAFHSTLSRRGYEAHSKYWSGELLLRGGYRWFPGQQDRFYLNPWLGLGPVFALGDVEEIGGEAYRGLPLQIVATAHMGWRF